MKAKCSPRYHYNLVQTQDLQNETVMIYDPESVFYILGSQFDFYRGWF